VSLATLRLRRRPAPAPLRQALAEPAVVAGGGVVPHFQLDELS